MEQLTVRGFGDDLAERIQRLAIREGKSLNQTVLKLLRKGAGLTARGKSHHGIRPSLHPGGRRCDSGTYYPADGVAIRAHTPGMHPNRALSGGRRNGLGARGTFTTDC